MKHAFAVLAVVALLLVAGCANEESTPSAAGRGDVQTLSPDDREFLSSLGYSPDALHRIPRVIFELLEARCATARYNNIANAIADGYVDINVVVPHMGFHYLKSSILDATFNNEHPELLVYANLPGHGVRLVAVEYAVPTSLRSTPPEGFTGNFDHWDRNDQFGLWTLHAWVWYFNPDGVFTDLNPRVP